MATEPTDTSALPAWAQRIQAKADAETYRIIGLIIRDVCEIERDPLPDQPHDEMRVTIGELCAILENRLK